MNPAEETKNESRDSSNNNEAGEEFAWSDFVSQMESEVNIAVQTLDIAERMLENSWIGNKKQVEKRVNEIRMMSFDVAYYNLKLIHDYLDKSDS